MSFIGLKAIKFDSYVEDIDPTISENKVFGFFVSKEFDFIMLYVTAGMVFLICLFPLVCLFLCRKSREYIKITAQESWNAFFWNGFANSILFKFVGESNQVG